MVEGGVGNYGGFLAHNYVSDSSVITSNTVYHQFDMGEGLAYNFFFLSTFW